ncbi:MAG TPA: class I SAM-dependent methyltransferase [Bryobacteraceae bacterium]|nr:class I SAM-dependent methyltransferase [Bryobacteraceae bacterium]
MNEYLKEDESLKERVREFWNAKSCGEVYAEGESQADKLKNQAKQRYIIEPGIADFAGFAAGRDKDILEIGVGMGADHLEWAKAGPKSLTGIDLTERAIQFTKNRLAYYGLSSDLRVADAEKLPFADDSFDIVYAYGVLHHSPDTTKAIREVYRVLRPGGAAKIMIYHSHAVVAYLLWLRYGLFAGRPFRSLADVYAHHLESPGTKGYTESEARAIMLPFPSIDIRIGLGPGDLLEGSVGQRHRGALLSLAKAVWPRWFIRRAMKNHGGALLITALKGGAGS